MNVEKFTFRPRRDSEHYEVNDAQIAGNKFEASFFGSKL